MTNIMQKNIYLILMLLTLGGFVRVAHAEKEVAIEGNMTHSDIEGGCWFLQAEDGKKYELVGEATLIASLQVEGKYASLLVTPKKGAASKCMVGEIVSVIRILETVHHPVDMMVFDARIVGRVHKTKAGIWYVQTSKKIKYSLQQPFDAKYRKVGARYNVMSRVVHGPKPNGMFAGEIITNTKPIPPLPGHGGGTIERKYDPR